MNILESFLPIRTFVLDVDSVLAEQLQLTAQGANFIYAAKDLYALQAAAARQYTTWLITARPQQELESLVLRTGISTALFGINDKKAQLQQLIEKTGIPRESILYAAGDISDYTAMQLCGLPCAAADAASEIKSIARYIAPYPAGAGYIRDLVEKVLKLNGDWELPG